MKCTALYQYSENDTQTLLIPQLDLEMVASYLVPSLFIIVVVRSHLAAEV